MEVTKKKKAYLKPEMSAFEVKTQEFIAGSRVEIGEIEIVPDLDAGNNSCLTGKTWQTLKSGKVYDTGKCVYTEFEQDNGNNAPKLLKAGFAVGDCIVMRITGQNGNTVTVKAQRVDCNTFSGTLGEEVECPSELTSLF